MTNRREFLKKAAAGGIAVGLSGVPLNLLAANDAFTKLTILHTNDMHSHIEPFPNDGRMYGGMGGMARRATLINKIRKEQKHVLLLDAGDIFQGTPYFNLFNGELEFKLMSEMKYDAATLGNHDFDNGLKGLANQLPNAAFPFLNANYDFSDTILKNEFAPYKVFKRANLKIGVFGLGVELEGLVNDSLFGKTKYKNPVEVAKEMVEELKNKECDLIICLSHLGFQYDSNKVSDVKLAQQVSGIDLIVGGHTHTFMDEPKTVLNPESKPVLINQVGWAGVNLGRIDYIFQRKSGKTVTKTTAMPVN